MARLVRCKVKPGQIEALYDGELPPWRARLLSAHVAVCGRCQARLRELEATSAALSELAMVEPSPDFTASVVAAVRLAAEPAPSAEPADQPVLAAVAEELQAPADIGGPQFVAAVMNQVRAEAPRRPAQPFAHSPRRSLAWSAVFALTAIAAASAVLAFLLVATPSARRTASMIDARLTQTIRSTSSPLAQIRAAAEELLALRLRQAKQAGLRLEDIGLPSDSDLARGVIPPETVPQPPRDSDESATEGGEKAAPDIRPHSLDTSACLTG